LLCIVVRVGLRPIETAETFRDGLGNIFSCQEDVSECTASLQIFQLSGNLVDGSDSSNGSSSVSGNGVSSNSNGGSGGNSSDRGSSVDVVGVGHNSRGNGLLDDGLSLNGNWDGDVVGSINMDWGGDLDNLLGQERSVIRSIIRLLDMDWGLDIVDLSLGLDNRGVDSLGSLEDSWDSNGKMGGSWLVDLGGISGNIAGLSIVNLLGDNWCGLVNGGDSSSLSSSGVRCWGSGFGIGYRSVGNNRASRVVLSSIGNWGGSNSWGSSNSNCGSSSSDSDSSWGSSIAKTMNTSKTKTSIANTVEGQISWGAEGTSHDKGKGCERFHVARFYH